MFLKFQFSSPRTFVYAQRLVNECIRNSAVTTPTELQNLAWVNDPGLDTANSTIIKTNMPSNLKSHLYHSAQSYAVYHTLEFDVHDDPGTKFYYQIYHNTNGYVLYYTGSAITGGTMASTSMPVNFNSATSSASGTQLTVTGNVNSNSSGGQVLYNIYTFWAYITDDCYIWVANSDASSQLDGFPLTYNSKDKWWGPMMISQYTRHDYHNTPENGMLPFIFTNAARGVGYGYGIPTEHTVARNCSTVATTAAAGGTAFMIHNQINTTPSTTVSWPTTYNSQVNTTISNRSSLSALATATTDTATSTTSMYGKGLSQVAYDKYPTADLTGTAFSMCPIGWEDSLKGNAGGNISERSGLYLFNGEYYPGDQLTYNGKTYMLWPGFNGYSERYALAVPME